MTRTTIIYAPHPDDETLYLSGYVRFIVNRGDRAILVAITDGGASGAKPADWTVSTLCTVRRAEQEKAWQDLTDGKGEIRRMGIADGGITNAMAQITGYAESLEQIYLDEQVEHYYAGHNNSASADHKSGALALKNAGLRVLRGSYPPSEYTWNGTPTAYTAQGADYDAAEKAYYAYRAFGWSSVKSEFTKLKANSFTSKIAYI